LALRLAGAHHRFTTAPFQCKSPPLAALADRRIPQANGAMGRLSGKTVLITGAAGGVGTAVCRAVRTAGGTPVATDARQSPRLDQLLDVTSEADWSRVTGAVAQAGHLDGLVNAAGIAAVGSIESADFEQWRKVLSANLDGAFLGCRNAFPLLRRRGG